MCCIISVLFSSKCRLFHNSISFGPCIIHILNTGCAKILKKLRRQRVKNIRIILYSFQNTIYKLVRNHFASFDNFHFGEDANCYANLAVFIEMYEYVRTHRI
jgi:hypothetical protein